MDDDPSSLVDKQIHVSNIPEGTSEEKLTIHFQRKRNGGCGDVELVELMENGDAVITFEASEVIQSVVDHNPHILEGFAASPLHVQPFKVHLQQQQQKRKIFDSMTAKVNYDTLGSRCDVGELVKYIEETGVSCHKACDGLVITGDIDQITNIQAYLFNFLNSNTGQPQHGSNSSNPSTSSRSASRGKRAKKIDSPAKIAKCAPQQFAVEPKLIKYVQKNYKDEFDKITSEKQGVEFRWLLNKGTVVLVPTNPNLASEQQDKVMDGFISFYQKIFQRMIQKNVKAKELSKEPSELLRAMGLVASESKIIWEKQDDDIVLYGEIEDVDKILAKLHELFGSSGGRRQHNTANQSQGATASDRSGTDQRSSSSPVLHTKLINGIELSVYQGDITLQQTDAIVNPANNKLSHGAGVAGAIVRVGGYGIQSESEKVLKRNNGQIDDGDAVVTGAGYLPCKKVIHAVGPIWSYSSPERSKQLLSKAVGSSLLRALENGLKSVSIPAISSGIFGMPKELSARVLFDAVEQYASEVYPELGGVTTDIHFVNNDSLTVQVFQQEFARRYPHATSQSSDTRQTSQGFKETRGGTSPQNNFWLLNAVRDRGRGGGTMTRDDTRNIGARHSDFRDNHMSGTETKDYSNAVKASLQQNTKSDITHPSDNECPICLEEIKDPKVLDICKHKFCRTCVEKAFESRRKCPLCQTQYGKVEGNMPRDATMVVITLPYPLSGYTRCGTIQINYQVRGGIQDHTHPNPGRRYTGTVRTAYLPDNPEGREVLQLLQRAFDARLTFTVGTSVTTGANDQVVWNGIHHKTHMNGGPTNYGYPDTGYLQRVKQELAAVGIQ